MFSIASSSHKPGWLAILPQGGTLTLAHVVRHADRRAEVVHLEEFAIVGDEASALKRLVSAYRLKSSRCTTLMGDGDYQINTLDVPPVPADERREALRWALRERIDYPVESACLGWLDIPGNDAAGRAAGVLVVSAAERAVRARAAPFETARVPLAAIDVPELAQRNVAALLEDDRRGLALLRLDANGSMLTLTFGGELVAVRRGDIATHHLTGADAERTARSRERLLLEMQRSLDHFDRQYSHIPVSRMILASNPVVAGLAAELAESVDVPVQELNLAEVLDFPGVPELRDPAVQAARLLAIGAALRGEEGGKA